MTLEVLTAPVLGTVRHGFFTRKGGASSGIFEGLNCGQGSSDERNVVALNRARVADEMGVDEPALLSLYQHHSADVVVADPAVDRPKADGIVTDQPGLALGILTADCAPVLFADTTAGVIGAAHAGWRGALTGVLENTLAAMEGLGADPARITVAIGPTISQKSYEVGPEFFENFLDESPEFARFFVNGKGDRMHFDLPGLILYRLRQANVADADWVRHCTYADPARFYSFRRTTHAGEADYGRLISVIRL